MRGYLALQSRNSLFRLGDTIFMSALSLRQGVLKTRQFALKISNGGLAMRNQWRTKQKCANQLHLLRSAGEFPF